MMANVHKQVMPESFCHLTALHAHSYPCFVSLLLYYPYISHILIRRIFYLATCLLSFFPALVLVPTIKCARFSGKSTQHRQVIKHLQFFLLFINF